MLTGMYITLPGFLPGFTVVGCPGRSLWAMLLFKDSEYCQIVTVAILVYMSCICDDFFLLESPLVVSIIPMLRRDFSAPVRVWLECRDPAKGNALPPTGWDPSSGIIWIVVASHLGSGTCNKYQLVISAWFVWISVWQEPWQNHCDLYLKLSVGTVKISLHMSTIKPSNIPAHGKLPLELFFCIYWQERCGYQVSWLKNL